ncbi:MAG: MFS transporter [Xanthobacteraceae bacterium]
MQRNPQELTGGDFARRLAFFYAALFVTLGVQLPFLPVWLAARGLDAQTIGIVLALPMVVRLFAIPMATRIADRYDALKAVIVAGAILTLSGFSVLGFAAGPLAIAAVYVAAATAQMPLFTLADVYALRGLKPHRRAYGPVRLWGSAAFVATSVTAGLLLDLIAASDLIWLLVAAMGLSLAAACALSPVEPRPATAAAAPPAARLLLRDPAFLAVAIAASLIQGSHALYYGFSTIDWQAAGFDGPAIGALWGIGVLAEIVLFAFSARLPASFTPGVLLAIGAAGAVVRWTAMAFAPTGLLLLLLLQCLHAFSFGATHLGTIAYVAHVAPAGLAATSQGYVAVMLGVAMAGAMGLSGLLYGRFGGAAYAAMAVIAGGGAVAALVAKRLMTDDRA